MVNLDYSLIFYLEALVYNVSILYKYLINRVDKMAKLSTSKWIRMANLTQPPWLPYNGKLH